MHWFCAQLRLLPQKSHTDLPQLEHPAVTAALCTVPPFPGILSKPEPSHLPPQDLPPYLARGRECNWGGRGS